MPESIYVGVFPVGSKDWEDRKPGKEFASNPTGAYHSFIVYERADGRVEYLDARPENWLLAAAGRAATPAFGGTPMQVNHEHHESFRDWRDTLGHPLSDLRQVKGGTDLSKIWRDIQAGADNIGVMKLPYRIEDQNSNTFVSTLLIGAGIRPQEFERLPTPGSDRFSHPTGETSGSTPSRCAT